MDKSRRQDGHHRMSMTGPPQLAFRLSECATYLYQGIVPCGGSKRLAPFGDFCYAARNRTGIPEPISV
jgi:hypothetical protein